MNKKEALDNLIKSINDLDEVKRIHELEGAIDKDYIKELLGLMHETEKKLVNARYYGKKNAAKQFEEELCDIKNRISDIPYASEYSDLLDEVYQMIKNIALILEDGINNHLK